MKSPTGKSNWALGSGEGGIRTPGTLRYDGFQDRCNKPGSATSPGFALTFSKAVAKVKSFGKK